MLDILSNCRTAVRPSSPSACCWRPLAASYSLQPPPSGADTFSAAGSEEYLHSEKYAIRHWDLERPGSLAPVIARINRIRRSHPALQFNDSLRFHGSDNEQILVYSKSRPAPGTVAGGSPGWDGDTVVMVVNLDPGHRQSAWIDLDLGELGIEADRPLPCRSSPTPGTSGRSPQLRDSRSPGRSGHIFHTPAAAPDDPTRPSDAGCGLPDEPPSNRGPRPAESVRHLGTGRGDLEAPRPLISR